MGVFPNENATAHALSGIPSNTENAVERSRDGCTRQNCYRKSRCFPCREREDGPGACLFGRSAGKDLQGRPAQQGRLSPAGHALWRQLRVCAQAAPAEGSRGVEGACPAVAVWSPQQGSRSDQDAHARLDQVPAQLGSAPKPSRKHSRRSWRAIRMPGSGSPSNDYCEDETARTASLPAVFHAPPVLQSIDLPAIVKVLPGVAPQPEDASQQIPQRINERVVKPIRIS